jgi:hypothetical protein
MDLETFITTVYVFVDDWYKEQIAPMRRKAGRPPQMSDSEVLTLAVVGQWQVGVPWRSERGLVRYLQAHGRKLFPTMLERSAFNRRVRHLFGVLVQLHQWLAATLQTATDVYECVDSLPLPAFSSGQAQRERSHWLWTATAGRGAHGAWFYGDHLLTSVTPSGAVTGWLLGSAHINDRWLLEGFLSARAGQPALLGPPPLPKRGANSQAKPPAGHLAPFTAVGDPAPRPYLADQGFNGKRWWEHWWHHFGATVITVPYDNAVRERPWHPAEKRWLASHRQVIETTFAWLDGVFGIKHLHAHSHWGQYTRIAAKVAAYNFGLFINRLLDRPPGSLATLLC